jgi:hypothetical protein
MDIPDFDEIITTDSAATNLHVVPMNCLSFQSKFGSSCTLVVKPFLTLRDTFLRRDGPFDEQDESSLQPHHWHTTHRLGW